MSMLNYLVGDDAIDIKTPHGHMSIKLGAFFPCSKANLKKLFKIIHSNCWNDAEAIKDALYKHFKFEIKSYENLAEHCPSRIKQYTDEVEWLNKNKDWLLSQGTHKNKRDFNAAVTHYKACANSIRENQKKDMKIMLKPKNNLELLREL